MELDLEPQDMVAKERTFELLPAGWYVARIIESKAKATNAGGRLLSLTFEILSDTSHDPKYKGRRLFVGLNLWHAKPDVVVRAKGDLQALAHACGLVTFRASEEFHGIPIEVKVRVKAANGAYEESNDISGYRRHTVVADTSFDPATFVAQSSAPVWKPPVDAPTQASPGFPEAYQHHGERRSDPALASVEALAPAGVRIGALTAAPTPEPVEAPVATIANLAVPPWARPRA